MPLFSSTSEHLYASLAQLVARNSAAKWPLCAAPEQGGHGRRGVEVTPLSL